MAQNNSKDADLEVARGLDAADELAIHREKFYFPSRNGKPVKYFCGNSLGLQHKDVAANVNAQLLKWQETAVEGHFQEPLPWFEIDDLLREPMAKIVGAHGNEVILMNTLTVNLHLLLIPFYQPTPERHVILIEQHPFPSDMYAIRSQIRMRGFDPDVSLKTIGPKEGHATVCTQDILAAIKEHGQSLAMVMFAGVHFLTGEFFDIPEITKAAHEQGALAGFDLAHAAGNTVLRLHDWGVDFACWCTYKYLNGGPGNIGGAFVHEKHDLATKPKLEGWWGHHRSNRFALKNQFEGTEGVASLQLSNPGVLGLASLQPSVELAAAVGMASLVAKSRLLTGLLESMLLEWVPDVVQILTPKNPDRRGCQLSIRLLHEPSEAVKQALVAKHEIYACGTEAANNVSYAALVERELESRGVTVDKRPPDIIRVSPVPMYNSFEDVCTFVHILSDILREMH